MIFKYQNSSLFFLLAFISLGFHEDGVIVEKVQWPVGEELIYKVKYGFIRLGTLKLKVKEAVEVNEENGYHVQLFIDSNPSLAFVNHHSVYESVFNAEMKVYHFRSMEKIDRSTYKTIYRLDYDDNIVHVDMTDPKDPSKQIITSRPFRGFLLDGTSALYCARANAHRTGLDTMQYLYCGEVDTAIVHNLGMKTSIQIDGCDEAVPTFSMEGHILGGGVAGWTGNFRAWFSTDAQHVPIKAEMKVFIGAVTLELESWKQWDAAPKLSTE